MRIVAEWDEVCSGGTAVMRRCSEFEGETKEEILAAIQARAGTREVTIVGLRNCLEDFAAYTGADPAVLAGECPHGFADSPPPPRLAPAAPKGLLRRIFDALTGPWRG